MKLTKALILIASLGLAANSAFADHRSGVHVDARYQYHGKAPHHGHIKHYKKYGYHHGDRYYNDRHHYYHGRHYNKHYYSRHVHSRHCGHHYEPAFNTRVKVFFGL